MSIQTIKWDGKQITKPGMYGNIPLETYHAHNICDGPSVSSSGLRIIFNLSPAHFYSQWRGNPKAVMPTDAEHFRVGRALHHLMLGEKFFSKLFAVQPEEWPDENGVLKAWHNSRHVCKKWNAAREAEGRAVLTKADVVSLKNMAIALGNNPIIQAGALNGLIERSIFWKDKDTGIWLKSRPDSIPGDSGDFVDLKTTTSVMWREMVRTVGERGYHQQGSLICEAARRVLKISHPTFTLIFAEKKPPYCTRVVTLKDNDLQLGERQNHAALATFAQCLKTGQWPGPGGTKEDAENIEIGDYDRKRIEERLEFGI